MIYTGKKVYDPITDAYSTGYWIKDSNGDWYPVLGELNESCLFYKRKIK